MLMSPVEGRQYFAIIGDIVASKNLKERKEVQEKLTALLNEITKRYINAVGAKFMLTLGDEFQGLLSDGRYVVEIVETIQREMHPVRIRFGIGVGEILTSINSEFPLGADGPAYHNARESINTLKVNEKKRMREKSNIEIKIENDDDKTELINSIFSLITAIKQRWTKRQREILNAYIKYAGTQNDVANELGINQSNVQKALQATWFYTYNRALNTVSHVLAKL